ncbi:MAG TPA: type II toxin-antitoxin system RatA family toxin [Usitatibacter sp.]|nr:type II toxin-antitoxin system RatA family toxin [Usitatibacter sp.]
MPTVRKSAIVPQDCATLFALVDDVEGYPRFLPWCPRTHVLQRDDEVTQAHIEIDFHGLKTALTTRNLKQFPERMTLELIEGPFESFAGEWRFSPLGGNGCRVELALDYTLASAFLDRVLALAFGHIADTLVDRFVEEAAKAHAQRR